MTDPGGRIADLGPEQLELLRRRLQRAPKREAAGPSRIPRRPEGGACPLSFAQQRLWFLHQLAARSAAYHVPIAVDLTGELRPAALEQALATVVGRHEALRTVFPLRPDGPVQVAVPAGSVPLPLVDLSALGAAAGTGGTAETIGAVGTGGARERELARLGEEEAGRPFDLERGPVLRGLLIVCDGRDGRDDRDGCGGLDSRGGRRWRLLLTLHHIAADNWSAVVLMREVSAAYAAWARDPAGEPAAAAPALPALPLQYSDYAVWQRGWLQGEVLARQLDFWRERLAGAPPRLDLPADRPRPAVPSLRSGRLAFRLPTGLAAAAKDLARQRGTTLYVVLLAAFEALLHRFAGVEDLVVGTPVANRRRPELEGLIGFFANTLLMRGRPAAELPFGALVAAAHDAALGAWAHQDLPFERLVEELKPARDTTYQPLFQVMFNLYDGALPDLRLAGVESAVVRAEIGTWNDLDLLLVEAGGGLDGFLRWSADLFDPATAEALAESYSGLLEQAVRAPEAPLRDLRIAPALVDLAEAARHREQRTRRQLLAVAASFTAEPLADVLGFWLDELEMDARVEVAPYHQVFQQLLDPASLLAGNVDGWNVVLVRIEDWVCDAGADAGTEADAASGAAGAGAAGRLAEPEVLARAQKNALDLAAALERAARASAVPWVVCLCPPSAAAAAVPAFAALERGLARRLAAAWEPVANLELITAADLAGVYPGLDSGDPHADELAHVPFSADGFAALGTLVARRLAALARPPAKVVVVDCDDTLWRGACAEEGPEGVLVGPAERRLQELLAARQRGGMLVCLCSKNEEADVWAVFDRRADLALRREHLTAWRIGWGAKSAALRELAAELGLGLESFVFLDDNPVECAEVRAGCPEVAVLEVPRGVEGPEDGGPGGGVLPEAVRHFWALDLRKPTAEDRRRTELYREELERERQRGQAASFAEFLAGLELRVAITPLALEATDELARVSQLTFRTNQFNATTIRRGEGEIRRLVAGGELECRVVRVSDRFGDYGLVGVLLFAAVGGALAVDTLLLSCRVLGRGVEHRLLAELGAIAAERGLAQIEIPAVPTARNRPVLDFLDGIAGASRDARAGGWTYRLSTAEAADAPTRAETSSAPTLPLVPMPAVVPVATRAPTTNRQLQLARELSDPREVARRVAERSRRQAVGEPAAAPFVAPRTPLERRLAALFAELLSVEQVGVEDSFFALGGHSLLGVTLFARLRRDFGADLPLSTLFTAPSVAQLAARVAEAAPAVEDEAAAPAALEPAALPALVAAPDAAGEPFPLTDVQQAYWIGRSGTLPLGRFSCHVYNEIEIAALDLPRFAAAWDRLIARHGMLRAVVLPDGTQRVLPEVPSYRIAAADLRQDDAAALVAHLDAWRGELSHQVLPAERWPLFELRATLLPGGRTRLHWSFDLLIADAWSFQILQRDLLALYLDPAAPLPRLDVSFRDYVLATSANTGADAGGEAESAPVRRSREYWAGRLATLPPPPELPLARSPAAVAGRFVRRSGGLDAADWRRLAERAGRAGLTPSAVLLTAYAEALATWSRHRRISLVLTLFNRLPLHPQVADLVGDFTSLTLLEVDHPAGAPFAARAVAVQRRLWDDLDHRHYSSVQVLRDLMQAGGQDWSARSALAVVFTSTLNLTEGAALQPPAGLRPEVVHLITQTPQVLLDQQVAETAEGGLEFTWDAVEELFPPGLLDDLFGAYRERLRWLAAEADWSAAAPSLVPAAQLVRQQAINATAAPLAEGLLHGGFLRQARRQPGAPAVLAPGRCLTYGELAGLAGRIGRRLRGLGARPDRLVAVVMEKGWEQVVAVLGVLRSGAAYLPLDPGLPRERLHALLARGEADIVLTTAELDRRLEWPAEVRRLAVDRDSEWMERAAAGGDDLDDSDVPEPAQGWRDLAYVIFTSGSTGEPKGVAIDHRGALNTVVDINRRFAVGPDDRVLALSALGFDLSVYDVFGLLAAGGAIVLPAAAERREPAHWLARMAEERVTLWNTVPALFQMLVDAADGADGSDTAAMPAGCRARCASPC